MPDLPGNPTPGRLAAADQRYAAVQAAVDRLVRAAEGGQRNTEEWVRLAYGPVIDAAAALTNGGRHDLGPAAVGLAAEALLRLAAGLPEESADG